MSDQPRHAITCPQNELAKRGDMAGGLGLWGDHRCNCGGAEPSAPLVTEPQKETRMNVTVEQMMKIDQALRAIARRLQDPDEGEQTEELADAILEQADQVSMLTMPRVVQAADPSSSRGEIPQELPNRATVPNNELGTLARDTVQAIVDVVHHGPYADLQSNHVERIVYNAFLKAARVASSEAGKEDQ